GLAGEWPRAREWEWVQARERVRTAAQTQVPVQPPAALANPVPEPALRWPQQQPAHRWGSRWEQRPAPRRKSRRNALPPFQEDQFRSCPVAPKQWPPELPRAEQRRRSRR